MRGCESLGGMENSVEDSGVHLGTMLEGEALRELEMWTPQQASMGRRPTEMTVEDLTYCIMQHHASIELSQCTHSLAGSRQAVRLGAQCLPGRHLAEAPSLSFLSGDPDSCSIKARILNARLA